MPTCGASLRGVLGIDAHDHAGRSHRFVGQHAVQFGKRPLRIYAVTLALLDRGTLNPLAVVLAPVGSSSGSFSNVGQLFYSNESMRMLSHNMPGNRVVRVCFQPSLSSTDRSQATSGGTSAFFLQTLAQPGVMVGSGSDLFARMEGGFSFGVRSHGKVANANIYSDHLCLLLRRWVGSLYLKGHQQIILLVCFVIPELRGSHLRATLQQLDMLVVALIGDHHATIQGQNAHLLIGLETIVLPMLIGQGRRNKRRWRVQLFVPFLGMACFACRGVLFGFGPVPFVGGRNLAHDATGHLCRQIELRTNIVVSTFLQARVAADLAMLKGIATHEVERIAIGQLRCAQGGELLRSRRQFEFGRQWLFHTGNILHYARGDKSTGKKY